MKVLMLIALMCSPAFADGWKLSVPQQKVIILTAKKAQSLETKSVSLGNIEQQDIIPMEKQISTTTLSTSRQEWGTESGSQDCLSESQQLLNASMNAECLRQQACLQQAQARACSRQFLGGGGRGWWFPGRRLIQNRQSRRAARFGGC